MENNWWKCFETKLFAISMDNNSIENATYTGNYDLETFSDIEGYVYVIPYAYACLRISKLKQFLHNFLDSSDPVPKDKTCLTCLQLCNVFVGLDGFEQKIKFLGHLLDAKQTLIAHKFKFW